MVAGKTAGTYDFKHKSELKSSINDECEGKLTATNKDYALELEYNPADLNKDGLHSSLEVEAKCTPVKGDWEGKVEFKVGGYELGPIKSWTEVSINHLHCPKFMFYLYSFNSRPTKLKTMF